MNIGVSDALFIASKQDEALEVNVPIPFLAFAAKRKKSVKQTKPLEKQKLLIFHW